MIDLAYAVTVTVRRGGGKDRWGDPQPTTTHAVDGCVTWPRSSTEDLDRADAVATGYMLAVPAGADLLATDEVLLPGEPLDGPAWQVDGLPLPWKSPFTGWEPGTVVGLTKNQG